ncbi:MAG: penicillin-binding protein 2 [bacterium]|nr:penicillin-binding protein 2 [bacterium]
MRSSLAFRTRILCAFFIVVALLLIVRLYMVQIVHGQDYQKDAVAQYVEQHPDTINRGNIFFTTKDDTLVAAAVMQSGWRIAIQPPNIVDATSTFRELNAIAPLDEARFLEVAARASDPYEEIAFRLGDDNAARIRAKKIPGVLLVGDQWRSYPARELAAHAIGFVGYKGDTKVGVYGLERSYQDTLSKGPAALYVNPFAEIFTNIQSILSFDPASYTGSIITSIEPKVQQQLEMTLDGVMKTYTPDFAGGIVMDPHTGAIYAIGNRPTFDPNTYNLVTDNAVFGNPLVEGRYELGSIMKPLTMAAGIDSGAVTEESTYDDTGCITVSMYTLCNFDQKARGVIPMQQILSQSLNLGASFIATKIGSPTFTIYMKAYGFAEKTGVDLPNEVVGDLSTLGEGEMPAVNYDTAAFGQGIAVSPMEMIRALSILANKGEMPNPHVVTGIKYDNGITRAISIPKGPRVLKEETADAVTEMLIKVFDTGLLNGELKMDNYTIAAKTGTAQIPQPGGGYQTGVYVHSFFGYFPARDPQFIVFLFAYKPHGQTYASATLARPFMDITTFLINYYNIPPDR